MLGACTDELDIIQSKQANIVPDNANQIESVLAGINVARRWEDGDLLFLSPDYAVNDREVQQDRWTYSRSTLACIWQMHLADQSEVMRYDFGRMYTNILICNNMLDYLPGVKGEESFKKELQADAYFKRAFLHYNIMSYYTFGFNPSTADSDLGVSYKTNLELQTSERLSVAQSFEKMFEDLQAAEDLLEGTSLGVNEAKLPVAYRASLASVYALKAQLYFEKREFEEAKKYAELAISNKGETRGMMNFVSDLPFDQTLTQTFTIKNEDGTTEEVEVKRSVINSPNFLEGDWKESLFYYDSRMDSRGPSFTMSDDFINQFGDTEEKRMYDLRFTRIFIPNGSYVKSFNLGQNGKAPQKYPTYEAGILRAGLTLAGCELIKAECQARLGDVNGAATTVNNLRKLRFTADAPSDLVNLSFANTDEAIKAILSERRKEFPYIGAYKDFKRLAHQGETKYLNNVVRDFYKYEGSVLDKGTPEKYTLNPQDYKVLTIPIPYDEILNASLNGVEIKQNKY